MATATIGPELLEATERADSSPLTGYSKRALLLVVAVAFAIRFVVVVLVFRTLPDSARHFEQFGNEVGWIARSLALHRGFSSPFYSNTGPTALLPPLYPWLLAAIFKFFGVYSAKSALIILSFNSLFSALTCIPIYLATRVSIDSRAAAFAAWGWAIYPFAIYFSAARVWEFSLTSLLITTCFWLALRLPDHPKPSRWLGFGLLFGLAGLSNPAVFSFFPVLLLLPMWKLRRAGGPWLRNGVLGAAAVLAAVTPWTVRNYRVLRVLCPVRDCFWYEFWSANNGDGSNPTLEWTHPASNPVELGLYASQGEISYIAHKRVMAIDYVTHHPGFFAGLTLRRILFYWTGFWSLDPGYMRQEPTQIPNVFFCSSLTLLMLFGMLGWWRRDSVALVAYLLPIVLFPIAYYISHPLMDYRQPIEPEVVVLVVVGLQEVRARFKAMSLTRRNALEVSVVHLDHSFDSRSPSYAERAASVPAAEPSATAS
jgi:4-amino-4-deoxy-L-arabinose transferase-like glycosyltransferase